MVAGQPSGAEWVKRQHVIAMGIAIAVLGFLTSRDSELDRMMDTPVRADASTEVVLFTTSWCGYCAKARQFLDTNGVAYTEFDIEKSEQGRREYDRIGGMGVPVFLIDGRVIFGLDLPKVIDALGGPATAGT